MKRNACNKRQEKQEGCLRFSERFAAAAAGILMAVLVAGCSGQRNDVIDSVAADGASSDNVEVEETEEEIEEAAETAEEVTKETTEAADEVVGVAADTVEGAASETEWREGYLNSLRTGEVYDEVFECTYLISEIDSFTLAYIDDDDIPELFFSYHSDPALLIYDPEDGFQCESFGRNEIFWQERTGNLVMYFEYISGDVYLAEYHLTDDSLEEVLAVRMKDSDDVLSYDWNGEVINREEFEVRRDTLLGQMTHNFFDEDLVSYSFEELCDILEGKAGENTSSESLLDAFLANEIPALGYSGERSYSISFDELPMDTNEWDSYSVGERIDLDNDGENELIINGPYGGMYLDAREKNVHILARGDGTAQNLSYTHYDGAVWIVYSDTMHGGRNYYWLTKYDGSGNVADEFTLSAEYWDSPDGKYHEDSDFTFRDQKITMEEYETLLTEIFGSER